MQWFTPEKWKQETKRFVKKQQEPLPGTMDGTFTTEKKATIPCPYLSCLELLKRKLLPYTLPLKHVWPDFISVSLT